MSISSVLTVFSCVRVRIWPNIHAVFQREMKIGRLRAKKETRRRRYIFQEEIFFAISQELFLFERVYIQLTSGFTCHSTSWKD